LAGNLPFKGGITKTNTNLKKGNSMKLIRYDYPNAGVLNDVDTLFNETLNNLWRRGFGLPAEAAWTPAADWFEDDNSFFLRVEVPGLKKENVRIELENQVLTVSGEEKDEGGSNRAIRSFSRSFPLPEGIARDNIGARMADGLLTLEFPKAETRKARSIAIQEG
jgi:HSP20 family protein